MIDARSGLRTFAIALALVMMAACTRQVDVAELRNLVGDSPVVMLSTSTCGYCRKLRNDLQGWGVDYTDVDVESDANGLRAYELANGRGVPILLVDETLLHGYSPERAHDLLSQAGLISTASFQ